MGDVVGRLFREFAITLSLTILVSAVVSLTLTPMMCSKLLRHKRESDQSWFYRVSERGFDRIIAAYGKTLRFVLHHQTPTQWVTFATVVATILLTSISRKASSPYRIPARSSGFPNRNKAS